jgi:hypothetical protein
MMRDRFFVRFLGVALPLWIAAHALLEASWRIGWSLGGP